MHHAKKAEASGFCYCNDIVLGILELLKVWICSQFGLLVVFELLRFARGLRLQQRFQHLCLCMGRECV